MGVSEYEKDVPPQSKDKMDIQLVKDCTSGKKESFDVLIDRYSKKVLTMIYSQVGDFHSSEDIAQETFLRAYKSLDNYDETKGQFLTWVWGIARNCIHEWKRKKHIHSTVSDEIMQDIKNATQTDEQYAKIEKAISTLPHDVQQIIKMRHLQGMNCKEIAIVTGKEPNTVVKALSRAYEKIKTIVSQQKEDQP